MTMPLDTPIMKTWELLGWRTVERLRAAGFNTLGDVAEKTDAELRRIPDIGSKMIGALRAATPDVPRNAALADD